MLKYCCTRDPYERPRFLDLKRSLSDPFLPSSPGTNSKISTTPLNIPDPPKNTKDPDGDIRHKSKIVIPKPRTITTPSNDQEYVTNKQHPDGLFTGTLKDGQFCNGTLIYHNYDRQGRKEYTGEFKNGK